MNFAQVRAAQGQTDGQWPVKITMCATFGEGTGIITQTKGGKNQCKCTLTDDTGESQTVYLSGQDIPTPAMTNQRAEFKLNTFQGQGGIGYGGWWQSKTNVNQQSQGQDPPASQPQQSTPQARQSANAPPPARSVTDISIERQVCVKAVGEIASRRNMDLGEFVKWLCQAHKWITDGKDIPVMGRQPGEDDPANWGNDNPSPPGDQEVPWDN